MEPKLASEAIANSPQSSVYKPRIVIYSVIIAGVILFLASTVRHLLYQSTAYDLGIFDQAIYLISQGKEPITSLQEFHIMGDHAAWMHYLLAIPYKIYPSVYWLFLVQSSALALGALPTYYLSINAGLKQSQAIAVSWAYLLYPVVFNGNLFDFHPEVIAVPLLLTAVLAARTRKFFLFCLSIILILGCKAVLSLTVIALGLWLIAIEKRRSYGIFATFAGVAWFILATKVIIPFYSGEEAAAVERYSYLGDSVFEIIRNLILQPNLIFSKLFSGDNLFYLILLFIPVAWGLSKASLKALIPAIPCVALNLIADYYAQKDLVHQYSLPALPFLILAVIASLSFGKGLFQQRKQIMIWSCIAFLALAKYFYFTGKYLSFVDNLGATKEAVATIIDQPGGVYTTAQIVPHLSHRDLIKNTDKYSPVKDLSDYDYLLLNMRHPGWQSDREFSQELMDKATTDNLFTIEYQKDDVYLLAKTK